jgi:hypothetical protein
MIKSKVKWLSKQQSISEMLRSTATATSSDDKEDKKSLIARAWRSPPMTMAGYR